MRIIQIPWEYVSPWSIIQGKDGYPWTVFPTNGHPIIWRAGRSPVTLTWVGPWDMAPMLVLDHAEQLELLARVCGAEPVAQSNPRSLVEG